MIHTDKGLERFLKSVKLFSPHMEEEYNLYNWLGKAYSHISPLSWLKAALSGEMADPSREMVLPRVEEDCKYPLYLGEDREKNFSPRVPDGFASSFEKMAEIFIPVYGWIPVEVYFETLCKVFDEECRCGIKLNALLSGQRVAESQNSFLLGTEEGKSLFFDGVMRIPRRVRESKIQSNALIKKMYDLRMEEMRKRGISNPYDLGQSEEGMKEDRAAETE